jgi:hypothetical protein
MSLRAVLLPLFVQVVLSFALLFWAGALRSRDLRTGVVRPQDIALRQPNWPKRTAQVTNSYANQCELPVLFYVLTILAWITTKAGFVFVTSAWIFVLFRLLHAFVHVTSNAAQLRGALFGFAALVLAVMWAIYIAEVLAGVIV